MDKKNRLKKITGEQAEALIRVAHGADVYDYGLAGKLRKIEKDRPELIEICKPMQYTGDGTDQMPYFGAIITDKGREAVLRYVRGNI